MTEMRLFHQEHGRRRYAVSHVQDSGRFYLQEVLERVQLGLVLETLNQLDASHHRYVQSLEQLDGLESFAIPAHVPD
jgi:hypothetical protein